MANRPDDGELEDELWGNLLLKRSRGKSGYYGVYGPSKSKKRPYQAMIKSEKTGRQQGLGSFATAKEAAVRSPPPSRSARARTWTRRASRTSEVRSATSPRPLPSLAQHTHTRTRYGGCRIACHHHGIRCRTQPGQLIYSPCAGWPLLISQCRSQHQPAHAPTRTSVLPRSLVVVAHHCIAFGRCQHTNARTR